MVRFPEKDAVLLEFGRRVRKARRARGWTQEGLAEKADMDRTYVGGIERGERNLALFNIVKLAVALGENGVAFPRCEARPKPNRRLRPARRSRSPSRRK